MEAETVSLRCELSDMEVSKDALTKLYNSCEKERKQLQLKLRRSTQELQVCQSELLDIQRGKLICGVHDCGAQDLRDFRVSLGWVMRVMRII